MRRRFSDYVQIDAFKRLGTGIEGRTVTVDGHALTIDDAATAADVLAAYDAILRNEDRVEWVAPESHALVRP